MYFNRFDLTCNRRKYLEQAGAGFGSLALLGLLRENGLLAESNNRIHDPLEPRDGHLASKAKRIIWLFMEGGPSGFDLFDPKPELQSRHGQVAKIETFFGNPGPLLRSPFTFKQHGDSGAWVSELYPHLASHVDDIAFVKSCYTESSNHAPALFQMNTGMTRPGFPSAGSWVTYGLGSENQDLPGFVVLGNQRGLKGGPLNWTNGFLPAAYQGTLLRSGQYPISNLQRPTDLNREDQRAQLDLMAELNQEHLALHPGESDLMARIQNYELAFRMQVDAPSLVDLSSESDEMKSLYGIDRAESESYGVKCLLGRRLVERGVRFVQIYSGGDGWDAHQDIKKNHSDMAVHTDRPIAGLLTDLKQRGLLESTLVVWGGEFGRMPVSEGGKGRDHNPHGFTVWFAGAGIKGGVSYGATDEIGYQAVLDRVSVPDLHATILRLLGIDHEKLTFRHNGRDFRLTDVSGKPIQAVIA